MGGQISFLDDTNLCYNGEDCASYLECGLYEEWRSIYAALPWGTGRQK